MSGWTIGWLAWLALFAVIEWRAIADRRKGDTLSEHVWSWFSVKDQSRGWALRRLALTLFLTWLTLHFLTGGQEAPIMNEILQQIATPLLQALAPVIAGLIVAVLVQFLRRLGLEIGAEQQAKVEKNVQDVVLSVEEWGVRRLKEHAPVTSGQKLDRAVEQLTVKMPGLTDTAAIQLIDQELPKVNLGATKPGFRPAPTAL